MRDRCNNPRRKQWKDYGGRGIKVCERWNDFTAFLADMGERPSNKHSIERRDNERGYEPNNCYWATRTQQNHNKRNNVQITFNGETHVLTEWARRLQMSHKSISRRLKQGWSVEATLTTPPKPQTD